MANSANTFGSMKPAMKDTYIGDSNDSFKRLKQMLQKKHDPNFVAPAPEADEDAMKYPSLKGLKGIAI